MTSTFCRLLLFSVAASAYTCYHPDGTVYSSGSPEYDWTACNASASVSTCCSVSDWCLSNGLCFQTSFNNLLSTQGCTDPNWGAPCHAFCESGWALPCPNAVSGSNSLLTYCCGTNSSCCQGGNTFTVPLGTIVLRPNEHSTSTSSTASASFATPTATPTTTPSSTTGSSASPTSMVSSVPSNSTDSKSLTIGLATGIPLGLALIGAVIFMGWELHRYNSRRAAVARQDAFIRPEASEIFAKQGEPISSVPKELDATRVQELP